MQTPAERIYDASAAALIEQQTTAGRMTGIMVPIGAAATAGALLLEPALHDIAHARWVQATGLVVGCVGIGVVLLVGLAVLIGPAIEGVEPKLLLDVANRPEILDGTHDFETEAAISLVRVRRENKSRLDKFRIVLAVVFAGLVLELLGLGAATLIQPRSKAVPKLDAELRVTTAHLNAAGLTVAGQLVRGAHGRVLLDIVMLGRTGELSTVGAEVHGGRFRVRLKAPRGLLPLRSATYVVTWPGSRSLRSAEIGGALARCPEDCQ